MGKKRNLILAIDFDGTIVQNDWPNIGRLLPNAKECINLLASMNIDIIIWTCRSDNELEKCKQFLNENKIHFDYINTNTDYIQKLWDFEHFTSPKIYADLYIDDRSICSLMNKSIFNWDDMFEYIIEYKHRNEYKFN